MPAGGLWREHMLLCVEGMSGRLHKQNVPEGLVDSTSQALGCGLWPGPIFALSWLLP